MTTFTFEHEGTRFRVGPICSPGSDELRVDRWCEGDEHHGPHWTPLPYLRPGSAGEAVAQAKASVA